MPKLSILNSEKEFLFEAGKSVMDVLVENGVYINNACNGNGTCGKCQVKIDGQVCLSCEIFPEEDITIQLLEKEKKHKVLTSGYVPEFDFEPQVNLAGEGPKYGVAVDIGTTTVAAALVDMRTGEEVAQASDINPQKIFGLDVLTRITYEVNNPEEGKAKLQQTIVQGLNEMIDQMCSDAGASRKDIYEICVAANCTMLHTLLGVDATPIGIAPYTPVFVEAQKLPAEQIGISLADEAVLYCLPSVSGYVGADIVAGAYVCALDKAQENVLFIDIGTNGEMVLSKKGEMVSCSCAAGPALEGMNITCGMRAADGAIEDLTITEDGVKLAVIGDKEAEGLCGSGILAVIKELVRCGFLKKNGAFIQKDSLDESDYRYDMIRLDGKKREFVVKGGDNPIIVTQGDVRQVQLAKGAILSGVKAMLSEAGMEMGQVDKVMIAGQFGAHLPAESIVGTEILPEELKEKIVYVGNSSKTGAYMALMSGKVKADMERLASEIAYIELAETEGYERLFAECINFKNCGGK